MSVDILKFRTPSLRNVALTAPYGHGGAYNTLRAVVEHHLDPVNALYAYNDNRQAILPTHPILDAENYRAMDDPAIVDFIAEHNELAPFTYSAEDVDRIMDFLNALTDPNTIDLRSDQDVVNGVPSGLPPGRLEPCNTCSIKEGACAPPLLFSRPCSSFR